jgi:hypothetical protein
LFSIFKIGSWEVFTFAGLESDPSVLCLLSIWDYRCGTLAPGFYAILDRHEILKGTSSKWVLWEKRNTNSGEYSKTQCSPFYFTDLFFYILRIFPQMLYGVT